MVTVYEIFLQNQGSGDTVISEYFRLPMMNTDTVKAIKVLYKEQPKNPEVEFLYGKVASLLYPFTKKMFNEANELMNTYADLYRRSPSEADIWFSSLSKADRVLLYRFYNTMYRMILNKLNEIFYKREMDETYTGEFYSDDKTTDIARNLALLGVNGFNLIKYNTDFSPYTEENYPIFLHWKNRG